MHCVADTLWAVYFFFKIKPTPPDKLIMKIILSILIILIYTGCVQQPTSPIIPYYSVDKAEYRPQKPDCLPQKIFNDYVYTKQQYNQVTGNSSVYNEGWEYKKVWNEKEKKYVTERTGTKNYYKQYTRGNEGSLKSRLDFIKRNMSLHCSAEDIKKLEESI